MQTRLDHSPLVTKVGAVLRWASIALAAVGIVFVLGWLIHAAYCAFTNRLFTLFDYGLYTNMIWNSGRGRFFRCLLDDSYLKTHLSFSLVPLGLAYYVWDHCFTLWMLQWLSLIAGACIVAAVGVRHKLRLDLLAAILLFMVGYHYSQAVMLSEYHGISAYLFLLPWLYYCLSFNKRWVWLPLVLIAGLREDAFLLALPMLLYVAVRDRWKAGYWYAGGAVVYGIVAIVGLFPLLAGASLIERRGREIRLWSALQQVLSGAEGTGGGRPMFDREGLTLRGWSLFWLTLPTVPFWRRRGWVPLLVFPSLPLLQAMGSHFKLQYMMAVHYPAPILACLVPAMLEAVRPRDESSPPAPAGVPWATLYLLILTTVSHVLYGFVPGGGNRRQYAQYYARPHIDGVKALRAVKHLPRTGTVICSWKRAGFCANRSDLMVWRKFDPQRHSFDIVFESLGGMASKEGAHLRERLQAGTFGVRYFDGDYVIMEQGHDTARNAAVLAAAAGEGGIVQLVDSFRHGGGEKTHGGRPVRYWAGRRSTAEIVAYGRGMQLEPGRYRAAFHFAARAPAGAGHWGHLGLHVLNQPAVLVDAQVEPVATTGDEMRVQSMAFELTERTVVEPRVTGAAARLWMWKVEFRRIPQTSRTGIPARPPES